MIIDELVLYNFGVYRGRQKFELTPPSSNKPIILIGGMNGGGKTTFLDALHLVLYGKRAQCSNRGTMPYSDFLEDCIHRGVPASEGAAIELEFRHPFEGEEQTFRVNRSWYPTTKSVSEDVKVHRNGKIDRVITDTWDEFVEEFMPLGISDLFFFDGEQIARFADIDNSAELLETAIQTLLGLDIVDQLATDLKVLERRKTTEDQSGHEKERIEEARQEIKRLERELDEVTREYGNLGNTMHTARKELDQVEEEFRIEGGELYERHHELEREHGNLKADIRDIEDELRKIAAGCAPLLLVREQLQEIAEQDRREQNARRAEVLSDTLKERDQRILQEIEEREGKAELYESLKSMLSRDREELTADADVQRYLDLDEQGRQQLQVLLHSQLDDTQARIESLLADLDALREEQMELERKLAAVPDHDAVAELIERRNELREEVRFTERRRAELEEEKERICARLEEAKEQLEKRYKQLAKAEFQSQDVQRLLDHSDRVRTTIDQFRDRIIERHIDRIESLVIKGFQKLLHKQELIKDLKIDSDDFTIRLWDSSENAITPDRLSAGERQLFAVSLLWGLARASGRPLPTVVDTPLGRLDSSHRGHLIERYFPFASHQVILLSTDEEIGPRYYERIKPAVGREYTLAYDDEKSATQVEQGYNILEAENAA